jgi:four helix bundle protein
MTSEELYKRTKSFALSVIKFTEKLPNVYLGNRIKGQLIRSSTSVAANYRAANHAQTKPVFIAKLSIVIEESDESEFWLEFVSDSNLLSTNETAVLIKEAHELTSIFSASRKTAMLNLKITSQKQ